MAGIPQNFQAISSVLANYNFTDIASGTGYINFYAGRTIDLNLLSNFTYYSDTIITTISIPNGADAKILDVDFDTVLNRPLDVKGLGIVNVPIFAPAIGGGFSYRLFAIVTLRKWDGVTETDICTNTSRVLAGTTAVFTMLGIDLTVPITHFKIGQTLRLTVEYWGSNSSGGALPGGLVGHDPMSRVTGFDSTGAVPSRLVFQCPVRLNL